ncbi:methyltransferase [Saccharopolyspora subtropica]|uniref:Methyltransferase n=2 Tax=Saccharopolyspora thermophila TaxID=89367 RepID=A0A917NIE4_9PSEU|nr:methyltransferase [Saccharopolyspora subtropica]
MLVDALRRTCPDPPERVLDIGTGTGVLAIAAARLGARSVHAVDVAANAVWTAMLNAKMRGLSAVRVRRGELPHAVAGQRFDLIVSNPPYVPGNSVPARGRARAWDAGADGRAVLDELCAAAPDLLAADGVLLLVQSALSGVETTMRRLKEVRLSSSIVASEIVPFGPIMRQRAEAWEKQGLIAPGQRHEELVVLHARRTAK